MAQEVEGEVLKWSGTIYRPVARIMNILDDDAWIDSPRKAQQPQPSAESGQEKLRCADCKEGFTMVLRKHHCKQCGDVFCGKCSSTYGNTNSIKERNCIKCASKGLLLRRKGKPVKSLLKSVVVKSAKVDKFDTWEMENWSPNCSGKKSCTTPNPAGEDSTTDSAKQLPTTVSSPAASHIQEEELLPVGEEAEETEVLIARPNDPFFSGAGEEDEDAMMQSQGVLCILPPSVYSFLFGE